ILRKKAKKVAKLDKKIKNLIDDMKNTHKNQNNPEVVGLAAPQIGKSFQIFLVDYKNLKRIIVNPEILEVSKSPKIKSKTKNKPHKKEILEGCLSLPHFYGPIKRADKIKIKYQTPDSDKLITKVEEFSGFNAQIVQHEIDHLNGILFIDKILEQKSPLYKFDGEDWEEVEL